MLWSYCGVHKAPETIWCGTFLIFLRCIHPFLYMLLSGRNCRWSPCVATPPSGWIWTCVHDRYQRGRGGCLEVTYLHLSSFNYIPSVRLEGRERGKVSFRSLGLPSDMIILCCPFKTGPGVPHIRPYMLLGSLALYILDFTVFLVTYLGEGGRQIFCLYHL